MARLVDKPKYYIVCPDQSSRVFFLRIFSIIYPVKARVDKVPKIITKITEARLSSKRERCITTPTPTGINNNGR